MKKHAKKSKTKKPLRPTRLRVNKSVQKSLKKSRSGNPRNSKKKIPKKIPKSKVVSKARKLPPTKRPPQPIRRNKGNGRTAKRAKLTSKDTKRRKSLPKGIKQSKIYVRRGSRKKAKRPSLTKTSNTTRLKTSKIIRHDQEGKRIKEKVLPGYRQYFRIDLSKGDFEQILNTIRTGNFDFLNEGLQRNKPIKGKGSKEPRAVVITIETSFRGKKHYSRKISDFDFIVRKENVKKLILDRMVEYQDNWLERGEESEDYFSTESGKSFAPKNITGVMIEFIY